MFDMYLDAGDMPRDGGGDVTLRNEAERDLRGGPIVVGRQRLVQLTPLWGVSLIMRVST